MLILNTFEKVKNMSGDKAVLIRTGMTILVVFLFLFALPSGSAAQNINRQMVNQLLEQLRKTRPGEDRVRILIDLGKFHLFKAGERKSDLDSGAACFAQAARISDSLKLLKWQHETRSMMAIMSFERGDSLKGRQLMAQLFKDCEATGDKATAAAARVRLGVWLNVKASYKEVLQLYGEAIELYRQINDREQEISVMREVASVHLNEGKLKQAEQELLNVMEQFKSINYPKIHYTYNLLSTVYRTLGDLNKGLMYAMMTVESMNRSKDTLQAANFYGDLARMYLEVGNRERSIDYYKKALQKWRQEGLPNFAMFKAAGYISRELILQGDPREALKLIEDLRKEVPPITSIQNACIAQHLAYCYDALRKYDLAEKYFLESLKWYADTHMDFEVTQEIQQDVGKFYLERKDYKKAGPYLRKALSYYPQKNALATVKDIHFMLFQVDSAEKDYLSAIRHFRLHKLLDDSIFNSTKSRQIEELQIQYETSKKENDILLLNNRSKLQETNLQQANQTKNVTFGGIALLAIILVLLYNQYRIKNRGNEQLQLQQKEIKEKNDSLEQLLEEKEWLLKEVNHRVKNNLHTVMSLLESQSAYLDDEALQAINQSRNRVYAMSLIHQKLYQTDNVASINMAVYLPELVAHLQDSFDDGKYIRFSLDVVQQEVDVSQAVPLGLILNEAITNSIKYAFPVQKNNNEISIRMRQLADARIELVIADNGRGLPADFDSKRSSSLGMKLMRGLTGDINGIFTIESGHGTTITIIFKPAVPFQPGGHTGKTKADRQKI